MNEQVNMAARYEREIPEGYEARIEGNKVIIEKKESEEEKTRKELIKFVSNVKSFAEDGRESWAVREEDIEMCKRFLTYLEKQKEQKLAFDDYLKATPAERRKMSMTEILEKEQKPIEWSEEDKGILLSIKCVIDEVWHSKDTSFGYSKEELEEMWNWLDVAWQRLNYPKENKEWSEEDEIKLASLINYFEGDALDCSTEDMVRWLKSLRPQPHKWYIKKGHWYMCIVDKPEYGWTKGKVYQSPEDNRIETDYKGDLTNWPDLEPWFRPATNNEIPNSQPHWKPSEEQMQALFVVSGIGAPKHREMLKSLYQDLKKL